METVLEYLKENKKEKLEEIEEMDILVFNRLVYIPFEIFMKKEDQMTLEEAYQKGKEQITHVYKKQDLEFFRLLAESYRYKDLKIEKIRSILDYEKEEQFMAMTILLPNDFVYVVYRGTTDDIIGWKEDFKMVYHTIPAQSDALKYLNEIKYNKIYVGGHSKGGNLAMYASMYAKKEVKNHIVRIDNLDGPGFSFLPKEYYEVNDKIISYIPKDSIVGRLLNLDNTTYVVCSYDRGIEQHNLYNWQTKEKKFLLGTLSKESDFSHKIILDFFNTVKKEEWEEFMENLHSFFLENKITNIREVKFNDIKNMILTYKNISEEKKKQLFSIMKYILNVTKENIM